MRIFILLIFWVLVKLQVSECQNFRGGGPSNFGYDASSACSKPYARSGRARFEHLPCDFQRQNWCTVAGSTYPWHAVRRFVQENRGLMRRMYGDERHISVLRAEIENNDVTEDDIDDEFFDDARNFEDEDEYKFGDDNVGNIEDFEDRSFTSRAFDDSSGRRRFSKFPKLGDYPRSQFHQAASPRTIPTTPTTSTTIRPPTRLTAIEDNEETTKSSMEQENATTTEKTTTPITTLAQIANIQNFSINEIPGQLDKFDINIENLTELLEIVEPTTDHAAFETGGTTDLPTTIIVDRSDIIVDEEPARNNPHEDLVVDQVFSASQQHFRPRPEYRPPEVKPQSSASSDMKGQLYQDVAAKEQAQPVFKLRGVNACPVKEEVVAPFWANNTHGEVLALLNLYPFEQYVHWEKCTDENKQMYCRDGCRCEQQYRLHRLLAYDPNNECRGIFSDWFKFPSCCVCRCYDLPVEFRVTSRSPRVQKPRRRIRDQVPSE